MGIQSQASLLRDDVGGSFQVPCGNGRRFRNFRQRFAQFFYVFKAGCRSAFHFLAFCYVTRYACSSDRCTVQHKRHYSRFIKRICPVNARQVFLDRNCPPFAYNSAFLFLVLLHQFGR
jgi:hypothetical protein